MTPRHELPTPGPAVRIAESFQALVPVIETERFRLRAPILSDFPAFVEIDCTERGRFIGGPESREDAWFSFLGIASGWYFHGHGGWTITEKDADTPLGFVALGLEPGDQEVELGYLLCEAAEGRGVASETARAVRDWAAEKLKLTGLVSYIDPLNAPSIRVAERLSATRDFEAEAALEDGTLVYRHQEPEVQQ